MLNTRIGDNYNANDVINSNDLRKRLLNIDSRFRTNIGDKTTNFSYRLEHTYKNVIRLRVASLEIPNTFYTFSAEQHNTSFKVATRDITGITRQVVISIDDGNYTASELIALIQNEFNTKLRDPYGIFLTISLNANNAKITLKHNGLSAYPVVSPLTTPSASANQIVFDFGTTQYYTEQNSNFGLGYNLGYRQRCYTVSTPATTVPLTTFSLTAEAVVDVVGDTYMFLALNDLHTVEHRSGEKYFQHLAKIIIREDKNTIIYDDGSTLLSNEIIFPSPVDLSTLNVQLLDAYGNVINLNGSHFSFTLEITEVLNTKLYDFYRNYIWTGSIPSVNYKTVQGSAVPLLRGRGP